jgi:hypothetical protein
VTTIPGTLSAKLSLVQGSRVNFSTSILTSIKKLLGIDATYTAFDTDILIHINTYFSVLNQVGGTPVAGFSISSADQTWEDFIGDVKNVEMVKTYIYLRVRLVFDPPATSFAIDAMKKVADELEWRLNCLELLFNPQTYDYLNDTDIVYNHDCY